MNSALLCLALATALAPQAAAGEIRSGASRPAPVRIAAVPAEPAPLSNGTSGFSPEFRTRFQEALTREIQRYDQARFPGRSFLTSLEKLRQRLQSGQEPGPKDLAVLAIAGSLEGSYPVSIQALAVTLGIEPKLSSKAIQKIHSGIFREHQGWNRLQRSLSGFPQDLAISMPSLQLKHLLDRLFDVEPEARESARDGEKAPSPATVSKEAERLKPQLQFGFEPTFTSLRMDHLYYSDPNNPAAFGAYQKTLRDSLERELERELKPRRASASASSYWHKKWTVSVDGGVIEIQPPPQRLKTILPQMKALFRASSRVGLAPEIAWGGIEGGGGHIHIDQGIFARKPLLLRNLITDLRNRPYIQAVLGEMADDQAQSVWQKGQEPSLRRALRTLDALPPSLPGRASLRMTLGVLNLLLGENRYRDLNLQNIMHRRLYGRTSELRTVELRLHRAQRSPEDFQDLAEFWAHRLAALRLSGPIPIEPLSRAEAGRRQLPSVASALFRKLVLDSGLPRPRRFERFVRERFPAPVSFGPPGRPSIKIRYMEPVGKRGHRYEVLVLAPEISELRVGRGRRRVDLMEAPELPGLPRVGSLVSSRNLLEVEGAPGIKSLDLKEARGPLERYRVRRWRKPSN